MAAALGSGSGATFALIAKVTDPSRVGGVTGLVGAAGGLGGFVPPLIMGYVYGRTDSYAHRAAGCSSRHRCARPAADRSPSSAAPPPRRQEAALTPPPKEPA